MATPTQIHFRNGKSNVIFRMTAFHLGFKNCPSNFVRALREAIMSWGPDFV